MSIGTRSCRFYKNLALPLIEKEIIFKVDIVQINYFQEGWGLKFWILEFQEELMDQRVQNSHIFLSQDSIFKDHLAEIPKLDTLILETSEYWLSVITYNWPKLETWPNVLYAEMVETTLGGPK